MGDYGERESTNLQDRAILKHGSRDKDIVKKGDAHWRGKEDEMEWDRMVKKEEGSDVNHVPWMPSE